MWSDSEVFPPFPLPLIRSLSVRSAIHCLLFILHGSALWSPSVLLSYLSLLVLSFPLSSPFQLSSWCYNCSNFQVNYSIAIFCNPLKLLLLLVSSKKKKNVTQNLFLCLPLTWLLCPAAHHQPLSNIWWGLKRGCSIRGARFGPIYRKTPAFLWF